MNHEVDNFLMKAKKCVIEVEPSLSEEQLYIVWFCKTLQNWKAMISTTISGDGLYFEVTHNGDKSCTYVDKYKKSSNTCIED